MICIEALALVLHLFAVALAFRLNRLTGNVSRGRDTYTGEACNDPAPRIVAVSPADEQSRAAFPARRRLLGLLISALVLLGVAGISPVFARLTRIAVQLGESRARLANTLNSVPQAICWKDCNGVFLGCNIVFARLCGFDQPGQIVGKTEYDLPGREHAATTQPEEAEINAQNAPPRYRLEPSQREAGASRWIDATKVPLPDTRGAKQ